MGISRKLMESFYEKKCMYTEMMTSDASNPVLYPPAFYEKLRQIVVESCSLVVSPSSAISFIIKGQCYKEIQEGNRVSRRLVPHDYKVNLENRTCSCLEFQQLLHPCTHAAAAIYQAGANIHDFVHRS
jgi:SWIM zinc finger